MRGKVGTVTFSGSVSAEAAAGETVTITVTKPDGTTDTLTTTTDTNGNFTLTKTYPAGNYSAVFSVAADALYQAASTAAIPFTVPLDPRTITGNVTAA